MEEPLLIGVGFCTISSLVVGLVFGYWAPLVVLFLCAVLYSLVFGG